ncbi:MAG: hypothetical protein KatS3mg060_2580 [Dehalococcoidia bacterium]|nr:MAG: hypothetical protein KatS3mg060_2580 [Dehalococcoidia bacterium]
MIRVRRVAALALAFVSLPLLLLSWTGVASAHERRNVGPYTFVVGFIVEPAFTDEPNGVDLRITNTATGEPVLGAEQTLRVTVMQGNDQKEMPLRTRFGQPGAYTADLIPTRAGQYRFRFTGTIDGTPVNELFESGPGRFNDVQEASALMFPAPSAAANPAASDASAQITQLARQISVLERSQAEAQNAANTARLFGIGGVIVGLLGLGVGIWALRGSRGASVAARPANQQA